MWNHRVIRRSNAPSTDSEWIYQVHEVYYKKDGSIESWTINPVAPMGEDLAELRAEILHFSAALDQPLLEEVSLDGNEILVEVSKQ